MTIGYVSRILCTVIVALFSFCTVGAYVPKTRRNPAAKIGIPTQVVPEKESEKIKFVKRTERLLQDCRSGYRGM